MAVVKINAARENLSETPAWYRKIVWPATIVLKLIGVIMTLAFLYRLYRIVVSLQSKVNKIDLQPQGLAVTLGTDKVSSALSRSLENSTDAISGSFRSFTENLNGNLSRIVDKAI